MKIAVFGAGAIGSYLAASLVKAGADVALIARGANLKAIQGNGLTLVTETSRSTVRVRATDSTREVGAQNCVFVAVKAYDFAPAAADIAALMGPETMLVTAMNGVPYWYFYGVDPKGAERRIRTVDPDGILWRLFDPKRAIGCVLYPWAALVAPGVVEQSTSNRFILGEPDGSKSARLTALAAVMEQGGLDAPVSGDIRSDLWGKLWGNLSLNPLSALTGATVDRLAYEPDLRAVARAMMEEARAVAEGLGVRFPMDVEKRLDMAGVAGARKTSMLQDLERGKPLEIAALLGAVVELAELTGHPIPLCRAVLALTRERARSSGLL
jgi:2-dehydropantoate 2-reductase